MGKSFDSGLRSPLRMTRGRGPASAALPGRDPSSPNPLANGRIASGESYACASSERRWRMMISRDSSSAFSRGFNLGLFSCLKMQ